MGDTNRLFGASIKFAHRKGDGRVKIAFPHQGVGRSNRYGTKTLFNDRCHRCSPEGIAKEAVLAAYSAGARHFGENYIQELAEKATDSDILRDCPDIKWHFIGRLQSNKVKTLLKTPRLWAVETVTSSKLADMLNNTWTSLTPEPASKLNVMVQVNTSGEEQKGGVEPQNTTSLVCHIKNNCPSLHLLGLMTIGFAEVPSCSSDNPDFTKLVSVREEVAKTLSIDPTSIELSMGMSADFQKAISQGSTNVRVGSTIFGSRDYSKAL